MAVLYPRSKVMYHTTSQNGFFKNSRQVWPPQGTAPTIPIPENITGCVLGLVGSDVPNGPVLGWNDRSPANNDVVPVIGSATSTDWYVTVSSSKILRTTNNIPMTGNAPFNLFGRIRSRAVGGAFMGWGDQVAGGLIDLWNYNPGSLIWHGYAGGNDSVAGAPAFAPDQWHVIELSYDGAGTLKVYVDELAPAVVTGRTLAVPANTLYIGQGRYSPAGDFDLAGLFIYDRVLSSTDRTTVRNSLAALAPQWTPDKVSGLTVWLDSLYFTGSTWANMGSGPQPTIVGTPLPTLTGVSPKATATVKFKTNEGRLRMTGTGITNDYTLLYVARQEVGSAGRVVGAIYPDGGNFLIGYHGGNMDTAYNGVWYTPGVATANNGEWHMYTADRHAGAGGRMFINGVYKNTGAGSDTWGGTLAINGYSSSGTEETCNCEVAEVLIYNRELTNAERQQAEDYLRAKWGVGGPPVGDGLKVWLEADRITSSVHGGTVTVWPDGTGLGHDAVPKAAAPTWNQAGMNNKPTVQFSGSPITSMNVPGWGTALTGKTEYTMFQVLSQYEFGTYPIITMAPTTSVWAWITEYDPSGSIYWGQPAGQYNLYTAGVATSAPTLLTYCCQTIGGPKFYKNGTQITSFTISGGGFAQPIPNVGPDVLLGGYFNDTFGLTGQVAAIIWYDKYLIDSERIQVETYLKNKYGIT